MTLKIEAKNPKRTRFRIQVQNRQKRLRINAGAVTRFCSALLLSLDLADRALSVVWVGPRTMRSLNGRYREKDYATDVLSFAYDGEIVEGMPFLGEIVIAPMVAVNQALRYGVTPEAELRKLLVHGTLHLMGYDHETDRGQMIRMQNRMLRRRFFMELPALLELQANP